MAWSEQEMGPETLARAIRLVHKHTGITMNASKRVLLQGRLRPRAKTLAIDSFDAYLDYVEQTKSEIEHFINLVTTHETSFFRTERVWSYFGKEFLPAFARTHATKTLKVWSAACSSGEEAYTSAIVCEEFRAKSPSFSYQIVGTDIATDIVETAQKAEYQGRSIATLQSNYKALFDKYLEPLGGGFRVKSELRGRVRFSTHNLFQRHPQGGFHIAFLRNVLIYFERADQERVLSLIAAGLAPEGILVIGESESLSALSTPFVHRAPLIYQLPPAQPPRAGP